MLYDRLEARFRQIGLLKSGTEILDNDQSIFMPEGSAGVRGEIMGAFKVTTAGLYASKHLPGMIRRARCDGRLTPLQRRNLALMGQELVFNACLPPKLVDDIAQATAAATSMWPAAMDAHDWQAFLPHMERMVALQKEKGARLGKALGVSPYEALMMERQPGVSRAMVDGLFAQLRDVLPGMIREAVSRRKTRFPFAERPADAMQLDAQRQLARLVMTKMGFDFTRGRADESVHPFCGEAIGDTRLTTVYNPDDMYNGLMGIVHETGHGLYQQNLPMDMPWQPISNHAGMAVHESQSLLREMQVGRSEAFCRLVVRLAGGVQCHLIIDRLLASAQWVEPSYIRTKADEMTYPLHVIMRYEIETALFDGSLAVEDIPARWDELSRQYLGLAVGEWHGRGCLQDIHWAAGLFGYFPTYTLGAVLAAQLMAKARQDLPSLDQDIARGDLGRLFNWQKEKVWGMGQQLPFAELVVHATGRPLSADAFLAHLERRYLA